MTAVVVELVALIALGAVGLALASPRHDLAWRVATALPLGAAAFSCAELVLLATGLPIARPWIALSTVLAAATATALWRALSAGRSGPDSRADVPHGVGSPGWRIPILVGVAAIGLVTALTAVIPLVNVTFDSFDYLTIANLLAGTGDTSAMSGSLLLTRSLAVGAVHGLAPPDPSYLRAFGPLVALSLVAMLWMLVRDGCRRLDPGVAAWLAAAAALLVATNPRFIYSAFFINGHMMFAAWLLLLVAVCWRLLRDPGRADGPSAVAAAVLAVAITVVRPDGALVAATALLPVMVAPAVSRRWRQGVLIAFGVGNVLWHLPVVARAHLPEGGPLALDPIPVSVLGMIAFGGAAIGAALVLPVIDGRLGRRPLAVAHGLAWLAVVALTLRSPGILRDSALATARNVIWDGRWGTSLVVLSTLLVVAILVRRFREEQALLFPLLTFVPLAILLAYLRDAAYRVGAGDSLSRMLVQFLPLGVLALTLTAAGEPRPWRRAQAETQGART